MSDAAGPESTTDRDVRALRRLVRQRAPDVPSGALGGTAARQNVDYAGTFVARQQDFSPFRAADLRGYARYEPRAPDPGAFYLASIPGWRVAVPRNITGVRARALLAAVLRHGPAAVGYVRAGDTLVPAFLGPDGRAALAALAS